MSGGAGDDSFKAVHVTRCRCCAGTRLAPVLDLGLMPLANDFRASGPWPRYPLCLMACQDCWHSQLSVVVPGEMMFSEYPYLSSLSGTFRNHCRRLVHAAVDMVSAPRPTVLDIACNDGLLLSLFREAGAGVLGVDPAQNLRTYTDRIGIPVENAFWTADFAAGLGRQFDVITAQNVFAHVPDPADFLAGCAACVAPGGVVLIEFPYSLELVARNAFDTIYHEHLSYFLVNSFSRLVTRSPLYIAAVDRSPIHGGSIRFALRHGQGSTTPLVGDFIRGERDLGMFDLGTYRRFRIQVAANRRRFRALVAGMRARGEKVVGYCAAAKGVVAMNYFGVDLDYVVDDTPLKQGKLIPGRSIPIVSSEVLAREPGRLNIVILAWNLLPEITARIHALRGTGDNLVSYVPEVAQSAGEAVVSTARG